MDVCLAPSELKGSVIAQPSKSDAHRRLICAAFANGTSAVENVVLSEDIRATLSCVEAAGCEYQIQDSRMNSARHRIVVRGTGGRTAEEVKINCGESGSTLRFMTMILAAAGGKAELDGSGRLPERPMDGAIRLLENNSLNCIYPGKGKYLPLIIKGELPGGRHEIDSSVTSQYLSGLMMALPAFSKSGEIVATGKFESKGYVEVTRKIVNDFGITIDGQNPYTIPFNDGFRPCDTSVEGDWSNASYFLIIKAMGASVDISGISSGSAQPDAVICRHIEKMQKEEAPVIDVSECPDIMPTLAVFGASMDKTLTITGGRRLRAKESDRIASVANGLKALGVETEKSDDGLVVYGTGKISGGTVDACNDHRIAMSFSALCIMAEGDIVITGAECVSKSYPRFFDDIKMLGGKIS